MYHELTKADKIRRFAGKAVLFVLLVALFLAIVLFGVLARGSMQEQAAASIRSSVLQSAMQCCAVEGSYPMTLSYLKDNYGLRVNEADFYINYEAFAGNVLPSVTVTPKGA